jgi:hypothetical protein
MNGLRPYQTTFSRHIYSVLVNGFMARELDADDHEFLEYVRARGIANGSVPNTSLASVEELEFWQLPYDAAPDVERRPGPVPLRARPVETDTDRAFRLARTSAWHARRVIRAQERAIAEVEMARERAEWAKANERRKRQEIMSDAEWDAADPFKAAKRGRRKPAFGATIGRHYVPQWKLDEKIDAAVAKAEAKKAKAKEAKEAKRAKQQAEAEALIEQARRVVDQHTQLGAAPPPAAYTIDSLKAAIMALGRSSTPGTMWREEAMMRALGCTRHMLDYCLDQLLREGRLRREQTTL